MRKKPKQKKYSITFLQCLLVGFISFVFLLLIGISIALIFMKNYHIKSSVWLAYIGSYIGTSLALVGTVVLGYIAIKQNKQAQNANDKLLEFEDNRFKKENTCMIEFDAYYGGGFRKYYYNFFEALSKYSVSAFAVSDLNEQDFIIKYRIHNDS